MKEELQRRAAVEVCMAYIAALYDLAPKVSGHHEGAHQKLAPRWLLAYVLVALTQTGTCVTQTMFAASAKIISMVYVVLAAILAMHVH